jgi:hypothetical protein
MAYGDNKEIFVKEKDGVKAPAGFHYMPNGKLMSDADHVALYGYIEKKITSFDFETRDVINEGETRKFIVRGDNGAVFSLEIYDNTGKYYNFYTNTWSTTKAMLSKKSISGGYDGSITFDALPDSSLKTYTINLYAETVYNIKTSHSDYVEIRNDDNSVNVNKSTGSSSTVLTKTIYQDALKTLKLSCVAPSLYSVSQGTIDGATSGNKITIDEDATSTNPVVVEVGDKITTTGIASSIHALVTKINPDGDNVNEIEMSVTDTTTDGAVVTFTPPFNGMTPHDTDSDTGAFSSTISSGNNTVIPFGVAIRALAGRNFKVSKTPTTDDLCAYQSVTFGSAALAIEGENTSSASVFHRWPVTNIANLKQGMQLDPTRSNRTATTPASISSYRATLTQEVLVEGDYDNYIDNTTVEDVFVPAVDSFGNNVTAVDRNGRITAQAGNIVFSAQQADALKSDTGVRIFAHGQQGIEALTGVKVELNVTSMAHSGSTNPVRAAASTTTSGVVGNSTTIGLTDVGAVSQGMTVSGVGIDASAANPTVVSKSTNDGAGNIVVSSAQTLESGQTLFFNGGADTITIRGTLKVSNMAINDVNIFFDVERFLTAV